MSANSATKKGSFKAYDSPAEEDASESSADREIESEEFLRARINEALRTRKKTPIQRHALELACHGFYPIPVAGIVTNKDTGERECSCQNYRRFVAKRDGLENAEICGAPGKHPTTKNWPNRASRDPDKIMDLFAPEYNFRRGSVEKGINIGIVTGPETGVLVLDVDGPEGYANLEKLEAEHGPLPASNRVITGSGGVHVYFLSPDGLTIKNSMSKIASKIDFRGVHGQVLAPPSKHKSGGSYQWEEGHSPSDRSLDDMPEWLIPLAIEGGERQAAEEAAGKPGKGSKSTGKKNGSADRGKARSASTNDQGWQGYLDEMGDHGGGRGFNGPSFDAMRSYFRRHGHDADATEFLEAYAVAFEKADKSKGGREKYHPDHSYIAEQLENARKAISDSDQRTSEDHATALAEADSLIAEIKKTKAWSADGITEIMGKLVHAKPLEVAQRIGTLTGLRIGGLNTGLLTGELSRLRAEAGEENEETDSSGFATFREAAEHLNTYVASILFPGSHKFVVETPRGPRFLPEKAAETWLAKVKYGRGANAKQVFPEWLEWEGRPDYIGTDFNPGGTDPDLYNLWEGFATDPTPGNWERIRQHILCILCAGDVEAFEYAIGWLAQLLQQPHILIGTAWLAISEEGAGKGTFFEMLIAAIGVHATEATGEDDLFNDFNDLQANKVLIVADESPVAEKESHNEKMRNNITSPFMRHTKKGVDKVVVRNNRHWVFTMNPKKHKVQVAIDEKSRRFFITIADESRNQCIPYFEAFAATADAGGREAMFHDLMRYQCDFKTLRKPYRSTAFGVMAERNFKLEVKWWREVLLNGSLPGFVNSVEWDDERPFTRKAMPQALAPCSAAK